MEKSEYSLSARLSADEEFCLIFVPYEMIAMGFHPNQHTLCMAYLRALREVSGDDNLLIEIVYVNDPFRRFQYEAEEFRSWWPEILDFDPNFYKYLNQTSRMVSKLCCSITPTESGELVIGNPCSEWIHAEMHDVNSAFSIESLG